MTFQVRDGFGPAKLVDRLDDGSLAAFLFMAFDQVQSLLQLGLFDAKERAQEGSHRSCDLHGLIHQLQQTPFSFGYEP